MNRAKVPRWREMDPEIRFGSRKMPLEAKEMLKTFIASWPEFKNAGMLDSWQLSALLVLVANNEEHAWSMLKLRAEEEDHNEFYYKLFFEARKKGLRLREITEPEVFFEFNAE